MQSYLIQICRRRAYWGAIAVAITLFSVIGPFGTFDSLPIQLRLVFFTTTVLGSSMISLFLISFVMGGLSASILRPMSLMIFGSTLSAVFVAIWLDRSIRWFVVLPDGYSPATQFPYALFLCYGCSLLAHFAFERTSTSQVQAPVIENPLLKSLRLDVRGEPQYLTMQDHYVEVTTQKGRQLVHMTMRDAVNALREYEGVQIHRSHWVNPKFARKVEQSNGKTHVIMNDGSIFPISRSYRLSAREAGIF